jgi:hypothetical protein
LEGTLLTKKKLSPKSGKRLKNTWTKINKPSNSSRMGKLKTFRKKLPSVRTSGTSSRKNKKAGRKGLKKLEQKNCKRLTGK